MTVLRKKEIKGMSEKERQEKLKELRLELIKKNVPANKAGKIKTKEIKKAVARLLTAQNAERAAKAAQAPQPAQKPSIQKQKIITK